MKGERDYRTSGQEQNHRSVLFTLSIVVSQVYPRELEFNTNWVQINDLSQIMSHLDWSKIWKKMVTLDGIFLKQGKPR